MILIKCVRGDADREAPQISDALITNNTMAASRGKRFLDDPDLGGYYRTIEYQFQVPHKTQLSYGDWITITCAALGLSAAPLKIKSITISGSNGAVWDNITAERYIAP